MHSIKSPGVNAPPSNAPARSPLTLVRKVQALRVKYLNTPPVEEQFCAMKSALQASWPEGLQVGSGYIWSISLATRMDRNETFVLSAGGPLIAGKSSRVWATRLRSDKQLPRQLLFVRGVLTPFT